MLRVSLNYFSSIKKSMRGAGENDLSELEKELEFEFEEPAQPEQGMDESELELEIEDTGQQQEQVMDDSEFELEIEDTGQQQEQVMDDSEFELEFEDDNHSSGGGVIGNQELELKMDNDNQVEEFANRFYELSSRTYESELEMDDAIDSLVNEMEREFFFKKLGQKLKKAGKGLLKKGLKIVGNVISKSPIGNVVKGVTQVVRGDIKGALGSLAKAGLQTAIPGVGTARVAAADALGFEADDPDKNMQAWKRYVLVSRETYDYLARNLEEDSDEPEKAAVLAAKSLHHGLRRHAIRPGARRHRAGRLASNRRLLRLKPGQAVRIKRKDGNIVIKRKPRQVNEKNNA